MAKNKYLGEYVHLERCKFDMCELIKTNRPKFIHGFTYMQEKCGLRDLYENSPFEKIKVLKERVSRPNR